MKRLLLLFALNYFSFAQAQIIEHNWTLPFHSSEDSYVTGLSVTDIGYVYSVHSFEGYWTSWYFPNYSYSNGDEDILITKTSNNRNYMWHKHIGGVGQDRPASIEQLSNGDLIISGIFSDSVDFDPGSDTVWKVSQGQTDNFLLKLDKDGNFLSCVTFGGNGTSYVNDLQISENDEIFICGWYTDTLNFSPLPQLNIHVCEQEYSSYLSKFDSDLNYISSVAFEGSASILDLFMTQDQNILYAGLFKDTIHTHFNDSIDVKYSLGMRDVVYGALDDQLNFISQRSIGSIADEIGLYIGQIANGSTVIQLNFSNDFVLENGSEPVFIDGLYAYLGTNPSVILKNTLLLCLSGDSILWHKRISSSPSGRVYPQAAFLPDENGNLIASYYFRDFCNLGENDLSLIEDESSNYGTFYLKIDQNGDIRWVRRIDALSSGVAVVYTSKLYGDKLYAGGAFSGSIDFDLSTSVQEVYGSSDPFITKWTLQDQFLSSESNFQKADFNVFPNPTNNSLHLKVPKASNLIIHDLSGREIKPEYNFDGESYQVNTSELANGVYTLSFENGKTRLAERFVVQH